MSARLVAALAVALSFWAYSLWVTAEYGYFTLFSDAFSKPTHLQVFLDLCIAGTVSAGWMWRDGRRRGMRVWPFIALLPALGSLSTVAWLVWREIRRP